MQKVWTTTRVILRSLQCHALHQLLVCKLHVFLLQHFFPVHIYMTS